MLTKTGTAMAVPAVVAPMGLVIQAAKLHSQTMS